ncbi:unnamed protein product (macronuclear) [Paramecium tetraurelia]|uniref:Uncharacterized protein n=1 Tax=Paramecium tetraurelia TaxID=5888 RepID=A0D6H6_PARTE|nr:uncharacterized protein GSPATT00001684001 [Paramecium tetraurelia]CAK78643.1 unnamed protein product [Paramecium tetraurelia]|eukprot:XP_001446040.1 hypothetical protein (macronuclear) [Paramecium tetraurelia strain d4-2]
MNQFSNQYLQGTQRKYVRLFVSTEQKKFIATVDSFEQNLSEQIANSYACACEQFQSESCSNRYLVTNIRQNGFSVIIPKELNIGQVLNDQSYITCKICKEKNKNKKMNNYQNSDKKTKKTLKESEKIENNLPDISPPKILIQSNIPLTEKREEKNQGNQKKKIKRKKKKNQQIQNQSKQIISGVQQNNQIEQNMFNDILQGGVSQQKEKAIDKNQNINLNERIDNIYCDDLISYDKDTKQQAKNINIYQQDQKKNDQKLNQELTIVEKQDANNKKNNLQVNNNIVISNESNRLLKDTLEYFQDSLNNSKEMLKVPNSSFQTNLEHTTRYKKQQKQHQNNLKQQQQLSTGQLTQQQKQNDIVIQNANQSNNNIHKNNTRKNKKKGKNDDI